MANLGAEGQTTPLTGNNIGSTGQVQPAVDTIRLGVDWIHGETSNYGDKF
jgi:hypothetical protein